MSEFFGAPSFEKSLPHSVPEQASTHLSEKERTRGILSVLGDYLLKSPLGNSLRSLILPAMLSAGCATAGMHQRPGIEAFAQTRDPRQSMQEWNEVNQQVGANFYIPVQQVRDRAPDLAERLRVERESPARSGFQDFEILGLRNNELARYAVDSLPSSWTSATNVNTVTYRATSRLITNYGETLTHAQSHAVADCAWSEADAPSQIRFFQDSFFDPNAPHSIDGRHLDMTRVEDAIKRTLPHEFMHSRDWLSSSYLTSEQRTHFLLRTLRRMEAPNHFRSGYVEAIANRNPTDRRLNQATEFIAVIAETAFDFDEASYRQNHLTPRAVPTRTVLIEYIAEQGQTNVSEAEQVLVLLEDLIHTTDPTFDIVESLPRRRASQDTLLTNVYQQQIAVREAAIRRNTRPETQHVLQRLAADLAASEISRVGVQLMSIPRDHVGSRDFSHIAEAMSRVNSEIYGQIEHSFSVQDRELLDRVRIALQPLSVPEDGTAPSLDQLRTQYIQVDERARALYELQTALDHTPRLAEQFAQLGTIYVNGHFSSVDRQNIHAIFLAHHLPSPL